MYCPEGYAPISRFWREYYRRNFEYFYQSALTSYRSGDFIPSFARGSAVDICEYAFLQSIAEIGVYIASPDGRILDLDFVSDDGYEHPFMTFDPYESARIWNGLSDSVKAQNIGLAGVNFTPWNPENRWGEFYGDLSERKEQYEGLTYLGVRHHSLPMAFIRDTFLVPASPPPWECEYDGRSSDTTAKTVIKKFGGWAFCLPEGSISKEWKDHLELKKGATFDVGTAIQRRVGRPGKQEQALGIYRQVFPDGHGNLSWKEALIKINQVDPDVRIDTLKRALGKK